MRWFASAAVGAVVVGLAGVPAGGAETVALDDAQLEDALLPPERIPGDWGLAPGDVIETEPRTQTDAAAGGWCGGYTDGYTAGQLAEAGSATRTLELVPAPDEPHWFVSETLRSFEESEHTTAVTGAKTFVNTIKAVAVCGTWVTRGEIPNVVTVEEVPFAKVGAQRIAFEITASTEDFSNQQHVVYVRVANNVVAIHSRIFPPDEALLTTIVKRAVKRLKQAAAAA